MWKDPHDTEATKVVVIAAILAATVITVLYAISQMLGTRLTNVLNSL
jgi:Flp pilus assembly pilin Flp